MGEILWREGRWDEAEEAKATADSLGTTGNWQQWVYLAYMRRHEGDTLAAEEALDSAWSVVATRIGREALDSVRVNDFGLPGLLEAQTETEDTVAVPPL